MRRFWLALPLLLCPAEAFANCNPTPILDGGGVSTNMKSALDGSSNCFFSHGLVDAAGTSAFPNVAALASGMANPTSALLGSMNMLYNGTTWDRWASSTTGIPKTDLSTIVGTATDVNSGNKSAGTQRFVLATDQPNLTTPLNANVAQINGVTPLMNNGVSGTGSLRHNLASDNSALPAWGHGATGSAPPAGATYAGANTGGATGGKMQGLISCNSHVFKHITTATDTLAVQGVASQTIYVCGWRSRAAGTATWYLENTASVNANCASTLTQLTGVASEVANSGETLLTPFWTGLSNTAGNGLCINSTGTGGEDVDLWYTQF